MTGKKTTAGEEKAETGSTSSWREAKSRRCIGPVQDVIDGTDLETMHSLNWIYIQKFKHLQSIAD